MANARVSKVRIQSLNFRQSIAPRISVPKNIYFERQTGTSRCGEREREREFNDDDDDDDDDDPIQPLS